MGLLYNTIMIKALLIDGDGVVIKPHKYFSERLREEGKNLPEEIVLPFFKNEYSKVAVGKADLRTEVSKYLKDWQWEGTVDELLRFWFEGENELDMEVLQLIKVLREKGFKCYLCSDHSRYRADDLIKNIGLGKYFDGAYFSGYVGYTKGESEFFKFVLDDLNLNSDEVIFFDDDDKNVEAARSLGIKAEVYEGAEQLEDWLEN